MKVLNAVLLAVVFLVLFVLLLPLGCGGLLEPILVLALGWIWYLNRVVPQVTLSVAGCVEAVVALGLLIGVAHWLCGWLWKSLHAEQPQAGGWRLRWTLSGVTVVILMFVAGISMIAMIHQVNWMLKSKEPIFSMGSIVAARRSQSLNNLKQIGLGVLNFESAHEQLPAGATFDQYGRMQHGWVVQLLPDMDCDAIYEQVNQALPWDHPDNAKAFGTEIAELINWRLQSAPTKDAQGYALSHYAANSRVVGAGPPMKLKAISDGASQTILAGEVNHDFKPWGHPLNWRDPAQGINKGRGGFGGRDGITIFVFADGSAHTISDGIDPEVLKALATPAAGDKVPGLDDL